MPTKPTDKNELTQRLEEIEKGHGKLMSLKEELRLLSLEYSDIRSRMQVSDMLMDRMARQMEAEKRLRALGLVIAFLILVLTLLIAARVNMGF